MDFGSTQRLRRVELLPSIHPPEANQGDLVAGRYRVASVSARHADGGLTADARHESFDLAVELRLVGAHQADPYLAGKMRRRARAVAQLDTCHVARVLDAGVLDDGSMFVAQERATGESLIQRVRAAGGLDLDDAITVFVQIAEVVAEAHARGMVLGDLRPEDLIVNVSDTGELSAKIVELGSCLISRGVTVTTDYSRSQLSPWTAPELVPGTTTADFASDIWSLGCLWFELLCGRRPFRGTGAQLMLAIGRDAVAQPRELRTALDPTPLPHLIGDLARWALDKDPSQRPDVHTLVRHLRPWANDASRQVIDKIVGMAKAPSTPRFVLDSRSDHDPTDVYVGEPSYDEPPISGVYVTTDPIIRSLRRQFLLVREPALTA